MIATEERQALSREEQLERVWAMAEGLLGSYGLGPARIKLLEHKKNVTFRVDEPVEGGEPRRYVMRVCEIGEGGYDEEEIRSELQYLQALSRATGLLIPDPVAARDGSLVVRGEVGGLAPRFCALFHWVPGRMVEDAPTPQLLERVGELSARIHRFSETFVPPPGFSRPRWDAARLFGAGRVLAPGQGEPLISDRGRELLEDAAQAVREAMAGLGEGSDVFGIIHKDLEPDNTLVDGDEVHAIDFADLGWGHYLYDIAASLLPLREKQGFNAMRDAFLRGYNRVRPLRREHEALVETFLIGRSIFSVRLMTGKLWDLPQIREYANTAVPQILGGIRQFLVQRSRAQGTADRPETGATLTTVQFLSHLRDKGIKLWIKGEKLRFSAPQGAMTPRLAAEVKDRKFELLSFLRQGHVARRSSAPTRVITAETDNIPLSFAQQRLWFIDRLFPGSPQYNIARAVRLKGPVRVAVLAASVDEVVRRHAALRTTFAVADGQPVQRIAPSLRVALPVIDLQGLPSDLREPEAWRVAKEDARRSFDLVRGPLLRVMLLRLAADDHMAPSTMHHIIGDGWSSTVLFGEMGVLYTAFVRGDPSPLPELPIQYADFAVWQRGWLQGEVLAEQLAYWKEQLAGAPHLELPTDRPCSLLRSSNGGRQPLLVPAELARALRGFAQAQGATMFMILLAAFKALLARYSGQDDIVVGSPIASRNRTEIEALIGFFANTLVLRTPVPGDPTFREVLAAVRKTTLGAYAHQDLPFEKIVEELRPERSVGDTPFFQVLFTLQNVPYPDMQVADFRMTLMPPTSRAAMFDLACNMKEMPEGVRTSFMYKEDLFDAATVSRLAAHYLRVLEAVAADPSLRLGELPLLDSAERHQVHSEWNDGATGPAPDALLHEIFAAQAACTPTSVAVLFEGERVTYRDLAVRVDRLALRLRTRGLLPEAPVGLCLERSVEMVVAILGVLTAGGAYVPLDPGYPRERLELMVAEVGANCLLTQRRLRDLLPAGGARVLCLDEEDTDSGGASGGLAATGRDCHPDQLAYVIYTSGSTGRPKGAMNTHRAVRNRILWMQEAYGLGPDDRVLQKTPFSFDVSVWEFLWPLCTGATLVVARPGGHLDPSYLVDLIEREGVTTLHFVPPMLQVFLERDDLHRCRSLRRVMASGEALPVDLESRFFRSPLAGAELHNLYGPTEAAVDVTAWPCEAESARDSVPIGRPIANLRIEILDRWQRPAPVGVPGELHIGGIGLARGYWRRADLTAERFVPAPWGEESGARLYRTGDLARFRPRGEIEYLGRLDHQVKIRGFRIELGEIETTVARHPRVREAVVLARADAGGPRGLVAYVVPDGEGELAVAELRDFVQHALPEYMVPQAFVFLPALPLSPNGKVDRRALPGPEGAGPAREHVAPRSKLERVVAGIWCQILKVDRVGMNDNFFDLGGHSLLMIEVQSRLKKAIGREVELLDLFRATTVASLARLLAGEKEQTAAPVQGTRRTDATEIAVIAMAGRFPGARDVEELWRNLRGGVESIRFFSRDEMLAEGYGEALLDHPDWVAAAGVLDGIDLFDAPFFGFNPREAEILDPQQRLFLECAWEAMERAGYAPGSEGARVGVYAGASMSSYALNNLASNADLIQSVGRYQTMIGNDKDYLSTRVSYCLNLVGPSLSVQTGCSSSLVAVSLGCQALLNGHCDLVLAGGSSVEAQQKAGYVYQPGHIASPDGHCRAFDARAAGTVAGSGVGIVVLKRLADALAEGDRILAVLKGSAVNNDGSRKAGYTAPSIQGQAEVIAAAYAAAGVDPATIGYVEAHGTATPVGDPIEVAGLSSAFAAFAGTLAPHSCALGSVKTNIGHLDAAAGVAGLIKTVLALQHREIPPSLHYEMPNPKIDFDASPFYVNSALSEWKANGVPRRAGVSSFGIGGTNVHVVVEEAPETLPSGPARPVQLYVLSAATPAALEAATGDLARHLAESPDLVAADMAFTLGVGRRAFKLRRAVAARDPREAADALAARDPGKVRAGEGEGRERAVAFLFPGQGGQHAGMAEELYLTERVFGEEVDRCAGILAGHLPAADGAQDGLDLRTLLFPVAEAREEASARLRETWLTQPALFVVEYALARLWMSWGVSPAAMIGHSVGEYVAACLAGVLPLEDALAVVAARGRLMQSLPAGAMLSVPLTEEAVLPLLDEELSLAAVNAPGMTVVSGPREAVERLACGLAVQGVDGRWLHTSHAFHSAMMDPILDRFRELLRGIGLRPPQIPFVSNLTGTWITSEQATDPDYWAAHLRRTVRFAAGLGELLSDPELALLEVGPGRALSELARQQPQAAGRPVVTSLRHPKEERSDLEAVVDAVGRLWTAGVPVSWSGYYGGERRRRVLLPTYPFERRRYWIEARRPAGAGDRRTTPDWQRSVPPPLPPAAERQGALIVVEAPASSGRALAARLREPGMKAVSVALSEAVSEPSRPELWQQLLWDQAAGGIAGVAYLPAAEDSGLSLAGLIGLARGLARLTDGPSPALTVIAERALRVGPEDAPSPMAAALAAAVRALSRELPGLRCRLVDLGAPAEREPWPDALLARAAAEVLGAAGEPGARWIAYRGADRWERRWGSSAARPAAETSGAHDRPELATAFAAPSTETERRLAGIWRLLLGIERVGAHDDFFELGGHSLLATQLASRIRDEFGVELPLDAIFAAPAVAAIAARIERLAGGSPAERLPAIPRASRDGDLPLSFGQQRLWFLHQLMPDSPFYNIPLAVHLSGRLDARSLERALAEILRRHESLRTAFVLRGGRPVQWIAESRAFVLPVVDLRGTPSRQGEAARLADEEGERPFDLTRGPLLRACLARLGEEEHAVLLTIHHIASDAWSIGVLIRELAALYEAFAAGRTSPLEELPIQYADFAQWQRERLLGQGGAVLRAQLAYWKERLGSPPPPLELSTDRSRPALQRFQGAARELTLPGPLGEALKGLGRQRGATLFMTLLAAFQALLGRYSGQSDVTVGAPIANRTRSELEGLIGFFVNTLVLRTDLSGDPAFAELLARVREVTLGAQAHQDLPFEMLVEELRPERDLSRTPLFQVLFALQNVPAGRLELPGLTFRPVESASTPAAFDLTLYVDESAGGLKGRLVYNAVLFDAPTIERMAKHLSVLLAGVAGDPGRPVSTLPLLTGGERQQLRLEWNDSAAAHASGTCLHELFEAQVRRTPEALALVFDEKRLSYADLNARANRVARILRGLRVGPERVVGICVERSVEMVAGLLAILKTGGAYLPLDPGYPQERLAFMLEDAGATVLLTQERQLDSLPAGRARRIVLDRVAAEIAGESGDDLAPVAGPDNLAYVIYTSGSTGRPKGAMNTHRAVCNRLLWMQEAYGLTAGDRVMQKTPLSFDVSVWELFWPLIAGAGLVVANPGGHLDPVYLSGLIAREQVTTLHFVPPMLQVFLDQGDLAGCRSLRRVIASGEALPAELERRFFTALGGELHNLYGPTEAAIDVTAWRCRPDSRRAAVPIGRPIANLRIYVLDREMRMVPLGVPGEIHIGGIGLARGYWRRPDLTAAKLVPDPWSGELGARLYQTGDLGRLRPGGEIEFLARLDHQVKIRGFRIELGEIEAALAGHAGVREAVVLAREIAPGDHRLVAYLVPAAGEPPPAEELRGFLQRILPEHMVPQLFVSLPALPLSPNGKVDRKALPLPAGVRPELAAEYAAPASELERTVAEVWRRALQVDRVGLHDNFFDLGGHSLLLVQVTAELRERLGRNLVLTVMFQYPTVGSLAAHLSAGGEPVLVRESQDIADRAVAGRERLRQQAIRQRRAAAGIDKL